MELILNIFVLASQRVGKTNEDKILKINGIWTLDRLMIMMIMMLMLMMMAMTMMTIMKIVMMMTGVAPVQIELLSRWNIFSGNMNKDLLEIPHWKIKLRIKDFLKF